MHCGWEGNRIGLAYRIGHASQTLVVLHLRALEREMSTPPIPSRSVAQFFNLRGPGAGVT